jgi:hypothetical protein
MMPEADFLAERQKHYANILNDLFDPTPHMNSIRIFEFVCALVRAGGLELGGFDPWYESKAIIDDMRNLSHLDLPGERFPEPLKTRIRLALLAYCTLTEMDLPYVIIANLLRLRNGEKYHLEPFHDLAHERPPKKGRVFRKVIPPTPSQKIKRISELAKKANMEGVSTALGENYDPVLRNAVYHSDYVLHDDSLIIRKDSRLSKNEGYYTPRIGLEELDEVIMNAFACFSALFSLYERCRRSFGDFQCAFLPYDGHYKGVLQFVFDADGVLIGFRVYWPNGTTGEYARTKDACTGHNLSFDPDGSINFMVGLYASTPGPFSPLVEQGAEPTYANVPGTALKPHWPADLKPYKLAI